MNEKIIEETFDFGRKRIYTVKYEGEWSDNLPFYRDEKGNLTSSHNKRFIEGELKEFDREGHLYHTSNYVNGKLHGEYKGYNKDGSIRYSLNYVNGKLK